MLRPLSALLLAAALAACSGTPEKMPADDLVQKPIQVDRVRVQYTAAYAPGSPNLPDAEALRLQTFLDQAALRPNDRVYIASPPNDPLAAARVGRLTELLARRSLGVASVAPPPTGVERNHLLVMVDRYIAMPPACPDWSDPSTTSHENNVSGNFGCANQTNLSLMINNPRDLLIGREMGPAPAEPSLDAMERYRMGQVKPLLAGGAQGAGQSANGASGGASGSASMSGASSSGATSGQ